MARIFIVVGALAAALAVMAGAFGAHALKAQLAPVRLEVFETAVRYQMYHALGLLAAGLLVVQGASWQVHWAGYLFMAGMVIFSGSLYLLVLTDTSWLGAITPLGGVAFIVGWLLLAWAAFQVPAFNAGG